MARILALYDSTNALRTLNLARRDLRAADIALGSNASDANIAAVLSAARALRAAELAYATARTRAAQVAA